jgi:hypothetical protein
MLPSAKETLLECYCEVVRDFLVILEEEEEELLHDSCCAEVTIPL